MEKLRLKQSEHAVGLLLFLLMATVQAYNVEINSTGSSVIGGTVNFSAFLYDDGPIASKGDYKFNWEDNTHVNNKMVVATFEKPPEPTTTTTTTTTKTTTTTPKPTTTSTSPKPNTTTTATTPKTPSANATTTLPAHRQRRSAAAPIPLAMLVADQPSPSNPAELAALALNSSNHTDSIASSSTNAALTSKKLALPILMSPLWMGEEPPYNCVSGQFIQRDPKKLYGLFKHYAVTKAPVSDFKANGQNWLQRGDMLRLQVNCKGSVSLEMYIQVFNG